MKIICVSGTPGTGKTTFSKILSQETGYPILDVKKFIEEKNLSSGYDEINRCEIVDTRKLSKEIIKEIKNVREEHKEVDGLIIDSHLSHYLPKKEVDLCIITKCDIKELNRRLKKRKYNKKKIRDNLDSEIFNVCFEEAKEFGHEVNVIITTKSIKKQDISQIMRKIKDRL